MVGGVSTAFSNLVLLGIPFMLGVYGQEGFEVLSLLIAVHLPAMTMASIILFDIFGRGRPARSAAGDIVERFPQAGLPNPLIIGILVGLMWRMTGLDAADLRRAPDRCAGRRRRPAGALRHGARR